MPSANTAALLPSVLFLADVLPEAAMQTLHLSHLTAAGVGHTLAAGEVSHTCMAIQLHDHTVIHAVYHSHI